MNLTARVQAWQQGEPDAFEEVIQHTQNLALGYAYSRLGDFHKAQDVVQEAFIIAHQKRSQLQKPEAFLGWLRGIVHFRCQRAFRSHRKTMLPLDEPQNLMDTTESAPQSIQREQEKQHLFAAIQKLPEQQRTVITLYYLEEHSQKEVAQFLDLSVSKVNNTLHEARQKLKRSLIAMATDTFREQRLSEEFAKNIGDIIRVFGPLVETRIHSKEMPRVFDVLGTQAAKPKDSEELVVIQRLQNGQLRCIATGEAKEKTNLYHSGNFQKAIGSLQEEQIKEAVQHIQSRHKGKIMETGIKALDFFCPLLQGSTLGIFGKEGVGRAVFVMELLHRKARIQQDLSVFFYVSVWNALGTQDMLETEPSFATDLHDNIQTAWIVHPKASDPLYLKEADYLDTRLYFNPLMAEQQLWPALDPLYSSSRGMTEAYVGSEHFDLVQETLELYRQANEWMRDPVYLEYLTLGAREAARVRLKSFKEQRLDELTGTQRNIVEKVEKLKDYFMQYFFVAESYMGKPGSDVHLAETIKGVRNILKGT